MQRKSNITNVILLFVFMIFLLPIKAYASELTAPTETPTISTEETKPVLPITPVKTVVAPEPANSDLVLLHHDLVLDFHRWIQSFAKDKNYYYFVQMTKQDQDIRITRVKYTNPGRYTKDHMDLKGFGHGTNFDLTTYKGKTYLWVGSNINRKNYRTQSISCIEYKKNKTYWYKAGNTYNIYEKGTKKRVTNLYPCVSQDGKYLYVRYTKNKKQYYQKYKIYRGNRIVNRPLSKVILPLTKGDFQGFDVYGNTLYTIEGTARQSFLTEQYPDKIFAPTIITKTNLKTKRASRKTVQGAKNLTLREAEGIKVYAKGVVEILLVSENNFPKKANIYRVK